MHEVESKNAWLMITDMGIGQLKFPLNSFLMKILCYISSSVPVDSAASRY